MANQSVLELAVGTGKWDSGLKKAKSALDNFTQAQGGLQQALEKDNGDMQKFVQMMGQMSSTAKTAKGQMNDYKSTIEQLTMQYNRMTDAQKKTIGQDYLRSIDSLKQKYQSVNEEIQEMNRSLSTMKMPDMSGGGLFSGDKISGMLQVFGGNLMTKGVEMAVSAVTNFAGEIQDAVKQGIELAKQGEGIRIAFERLGRGDILQGLREATHGTVSDLELMKAAVKFNDFKLPVEELGTMLAFAQQKAKDTGQSVDYMVDSIVTGLGRKSLMILDNLGLSANEIKEKMKETGDMTTAVGAIIREQMSKAGDYVETAADRAAQANVNLQNKMEELGRTFQPLQEASNTFWTSMKISILDVVGGPLADLLNGLTEAGRLQNALNKANGGGNGERSKVATQLDTLRNARKSGTDFMSRRIYGSTVEGYNRDIIAIDTMLKESKGRDASTSIRQANERFGQNFRSLNEIKDFQNALRAMRDEYVAGAKDIMKPVTVNINTDDAERDLASLKKKLNELQEQRKKAIKAGDSDQVKTLTQQINQTKADIRGLDPKALSTTSGTNPVKQAQEKVAAAYHEHEQSLEKAKMSLDNGTSNEAEYKKKLLSAEERLWDALGDAYNVHKDPKYKEAQDECAKKIQQLGGEVTASIEAQKKAEQSARELVRAQSLLAEAQAELANAQGTGDLKQIYAAEKKVESAQGRLNGLQGTGNAGVEVPVNLTVSNLEAFKGKMKEEIASADLGESVAKSMESLSDATAISTIMQTAIQNGIDTAQFDTSGLMKKLLNGEDISDDTIQAYVDQLNNLLKEKFDETEWPEVLIKFNADTNEVVNAARGQEKEAQKTQKAWGLAAQSVNNLGTALNNIEDPGVKAAGTVIKAIADIALGFAQASVQAGSLGPWAWLAWLAAGTAAMATTISTVHSVTGFANGGIVPGNSFSGDNLRTSDYGISSGELILNKAQQNTIAQQLEDNDIGAGASQPYVTGDVIVLGANNFLRSDGQGELVTTRFLRDRGII